MVRLGQRLHQKRLQRKQSLEEIAQEIKIKPAFLAAIEKGDFHKLPAPAYAQGFVKNYASYLGFSRTEITALFKREFDEKKAFKVLPDSMVKTKEFPLQRVRIQQSLIVLVVIMLLVFSYLFYQYRSAFFPPQLTLTSPTSEKTTSEELVVSGKTDSNATVVVNEQPVSLDSDGAFHKTIILFPGSTTIAVKATNKFGKETVIERTILLE